MTVARLYPYPFPIRPATGEEGRLRKAASEAFMDKDLAKSGLVYSDIKAYPCTLEIRLHSKYADAGYAFPYYDLQGNTLHDARGGLSLHMHRIKWHYPPTLSRDIRKKETPKYWQPSTAVLGENANLPYLLPVTDPAEVDTCFIVEGEKKAAALRKRWNVRVIAIGGCSNWRHWDVESTSLLHPWIADYLAMHNIKYVVIIPDGDIRRFKINEQYRGLSDCIRELKIDVTVKNFSLLKPDKVDDWLVENPVAGLEAVDDWEDFPIEQMSESVDGMMVRYNLIPDRRHGATIIATNEYNTTALLANHPVFKSILRWNEDKLDIEGGEDLAIELLNTLQSRFHMPTLARATVKACVGFVARKDSFSPIKDWLDNLVWDGKKRLDTWPIVCAGVRDTPYNREVAAKWIIGAVARRFEPGCAVDYMIIWYGKQGIGKSSMIRIIFGPQHTLEYTRGGMEGKDYLLAIHSNKMAISDEELGGMARAEQRHLKANITIKSDHFRAPYSAESIDHPRRFILTGSTNDKEMLPRDNTGHRRYGVVEMGQVDFKWLERWREQLWAEAVYRYKGGGVDYSNIVGTSDHVQEYVMVGYELEQVEVATRMWWNNPISQKQVVEHEGKQWFWVQLSQYELYGYIPAGSLRGFHGHSYSSAMAELGFIKVRQKFIEGTHRNSVYLYPYKRVGI